MNVIIKYRARAKYVISYLKFNNPIRKKTIFYEFLYGSTNILFTNERNTKVIGIRGISSNNSSSSIYEGDIYISLLVLNIRKSYKSRVFQPIAREEPKACATSRKVLGLGNIFPLPSSTTSNHPIFRRLVRWTPARLTRIYVMMHSSALGEGQVRIFVRDSSPGGVRLSGAIRPSSDVIQEVRDPPGGEELGKNTRRALPIFWTVWASIWPRWGRYTGVSLLDCLVIRAAHRDDVYSYIHGQMRIGFVCISGHHSRPLALFWPRLDLPSFSYVWIEATNLTTHLYFLFAGWLTNL
jgi:hypothetical protein